MFKSSWLIFLFLLIIRIDFHISDENFEEYSKTFQSELNETLQKLQNFEQTLKRLIRSAVRFSLPYLMRIAEETNISSSCIKDGLQFIKDLIQLKEWPLKVLDSFGKPSAGILSGTMWIQGDYYQCINIGNDIETSSKHVKGKYCAVIIKTPSFKREIFEVISTKYNNSIVQLLEKLIKPFHLSQIIQVIEKSRLRFDVCIPNSYNEDDLETILKHLFHGEISIEVEFCRTQERQIIYSTTQIICLFFLSFFFVLVTLVTCLDIALKFQIKPKCIDKEIFLKNITSVSALSSVRKLFSDSLFENTRSLCGIKTLIINSIIFNHGIGLLNLIPYLPEKVMNIQKLLDYLPLQILFNASSMVEIFFFISGFLILYRRRKKGKVSKIHYIVFLFKRIIRLTIPVICILAIIIIYPLFADGPHWQSITRLCHYVEQNWWKIIFHIQNIFRMEFNAGDLFWFLNALVQLTILTLPSLFILDRWPLFELITDCSMMM